MQSVAIFLSSDACVGVTDDGNQHIENVDLCNDRSKYEVEPNQVGVPVLGEIVKTEFTKSQQVLIQQAVQDVRIFVEFICEIVVEDRWVLVILALGCGISRQVHN